MDKLNNLSLEQQLKLALIQRKINDLNLQESRKYLSLMLRYMLIKDNVIKFIIRSKNIGENIP
uniref:Uncharacterized protein ycf18 n=1 Tax=Acrochaetium secundatum TaxID=209631 RepID=A0A4D6BMR9_9FLOR|nr:phycobilisome degradation protein [Acrochaetium secundatum]QBX88498.1 phycobilisome degradation protein [Acrochaetium secundatum]